MEYDQAENDSFERIFDINPFNEDISAEPARVFSLFSISAAAKALVLSGDDIRSLCRVGLLTEVVFDNRELVTFESMFSLVSHVSEHFFPPCSSDAGAPDAPGQGA